MTPQVAMETIVEELRKCESLISRERKVVVDKAVIALKDFVNPGDPGEAEHSEQ